MELLPRTIPRRRAVAFAAAVVSVLIGLQYHAEGYLWGFRGGGSGCSTGLPGEWRVYHDQGRVYIHHRGGAVEMTPEFFGGDDPDDPWSVREDLDFAGTFDLRWSGGGFEPPQLKSMWSWYQRSVNFNLDFGDRGTISTTAAALVTAPDESLAPIERTFRDELLRKTALMNWSAAELGGERQYTFYWGAMATNALLVILPLTTLTCVLLSFRELARLARIRRARGCPLCGYPIAGLPSPVCPECGTEFGQVIEPETRAAA